jgi:hypothetical protein
MSCVEQEICEIKAKLKAYTSCKLLPLRHKYTKKIFKETKVLTTIYVVILPSLSTMPIVIA